MREVELVDHVRVAMFEAATAKGFPTGLVEAVYEERGDAVVVIRLRIEVFG